MDSAHTPPPVDDPSGLTITNVKTICTAPEGIRLVVVKLETSEPELYGLGCATFTQRPRAVVEAVEHYLKPFVLGRDPNQIEDIYQSALVSSYWRSGPVLNNALSGIDMALWDIKGKLAGMPVYQLLGGKCRVAAALYAHASGRDAAEVEESARRFMAQGYRYVRCQVAVPGQATYGVQSTGSAWAQSLGLGQAPWDSAAYCRLIPKLFEHLRQVLGEEVELLHDVHERVHPIEAVGLAKALEPYRLFFLEDPLAPEDIGYLRMLRQQSHTPVAIGELFVNPAEYVPLVQERLLDFMRVHLSDIGGFTPARKLAAFCEFFGVRTAWHGPGDVSPVGHAANLHLDLACPNFGVQEQHVFGEAAQAVFPGCPEVRDGYLWPSDQPGFGVDIDEALAAKYPFPEHPLNGAWPAVRRADGSVVRP